MFDEALKSFPVVDDFEDRSCHFMGQFDASLGFRTYPFEVEVHKRTCGAYEMVIRPIEPQETDRDLFYVNTPRSNALCYQLEQFLNAALKSKVALAWRDATQQFYDRFVFDLDQVQKV